MIAATTAKTPMQIATVNQKTKSIRSPSFESLSGSQGMKIATAVATAADEQGDHDDPDDYSPSHRDRAYSTFGKPAVVSVDLERGRRGKQGG